MQTLTVRAAGAAGINALELPAALVPGVEDSFTVRAPGGVALTYDLDGDGAFDDTPSVVGGAKRLKLPTPRRSRSRRRSARARSCTASSSRR